MISVKSLKNKIYKATQKYTSCLYHDMYWEGVSLIEDIIINVISENGNDYKFYISVPDGGYRTSSDGMSKWKVYNISIFKNGEDTPCINGTLTCHAAGTVDDPFKSYDISLVL